MNYTLHQLHVFLKVTQIKSITKAAEELNLTQPAVSIQLKNFQDQFDIPLTEIIGRRLFVTEFGHEVALAAEKILEQVYAINYKTMAFKGKLTGKLKISVVSTAKYVIPYFLADFLKLNSEIELVLDVTNKDKVVSCIENNEVDFAMVSILPEKLKIDNLELLQNKLYLVSNTDINLEKKTYTCKILEELPIIYRENGSGTRLTMENFFTKNNLKVRKKIELTSNEAVKQAIIAGLGNSVMPLIGIKSELANYELQIIPVKNLPIITTWNLIWLSDKKLSPVATAYLEYIKTHKDEIISQKFDWFEKY